MNAIAVIGAGAWGTALASVHARAGRDVRLYCRDAAAAQAMARTGENARYLPGLALPAGVAVSSDAAAALRDAAIVLFVVPAQALRRSARDLAAIVPKTALCVVCAKGIERETGRFASQVLAEEIPGRRLAVLSGPSFAADVAAGLPTAVTIAADDQTTADAAARALSAPNFRGYAATDVIGVEAGGALKNVLALACGMAAGRALGASAQAALVTRGFVEIRRLGAALGARPDTLMGLSGLGDLFLTCSSGQSRNFTYGAALGAEADLSGLKLAEGVHSARIAADLAARHEIEAPIIEAVAAILDGRLAVEAAIDGLLSRPLKREDV